MLPALTRFPSAVILAAAVLSGCTTSPTPKSARTPTDPSHIQILQVEPPAGSYEEIGNVGDTEIRTPTQGHNDLTASMSGEFGPGASQADDFGEHERDSPRTAGPNPYNELRRQAAALGADAVIVTSRHVNRSPNQILGAPPLVETFSVTGAAIRYKQINQDLSMGVPISPDSQAALAAAARENQGASTALRASPPALPAAPTRTAPVLPPRIRTEDAAVVRMSRFIVEATRLDRQPWTYSSFHGMEILSRASKEQDEWLLRGFENGRWVLEHLLPNDCPIESSVPLTVIIDDQSGPTFLGEDLHPSPLQFQEPAGDASAWGGISAGAAQEHIVSSDDDAVAVGVNVHNAATERIFLSSSLGLRERLLHAVPQFPAWFAVGLFGRYGLLRLPFVVIPVGVNADGIETGENGRAELPGHAPSLQAIGPITQWLSSAETVRLEEEFHHGKRADRTLLPPLGRLFGEAPPPAPEAARWASEAGLFARWALLGPGRQNPGLAAAFSKFLERARHGPVTERSFIECFGFDYAAMEDRLAAFIPDVLGRPAVIPGTVPWPDLLGHRRTEATADQIGRILGDWLRMEGDGLKARHPALGQEFLDAAGRVLQRANQNDLQTAAVREPGFLAVLGLYENDVGHLAEARTLLEASCRAQVVRPLAYLELTWLRYGEAVAKPAGPGGHLSAGQIAAISDLFFQARDQTPALPDTYVLLADAWAQSAAKPNPNVVAALAGGAALFPRNAPLAYRSAAVSAQHGFAAEAREIVDRGLAMFSDDPIAEARFRELRASLGLPPRSYERGHISTAASVGH